MFIPSSFLSCICFSSNVNLLWSPGSWINRLHFSWPPWILLSLAVRTILSNPCHLTCYLQQYSPGLKPFRLFMLYNFPNCFVSSFPSRLSWASCSCFTTFAIVLLTMLAMVLLTMASCSLGTIEVSPQLLSQVSSLLLSIASLVILIYCWFQFHGAYFFPSVVTTVFITVYLVLCICKHRYFTTYWVPCSGNHTLNHCQSHSYVLQKRYSLALLITCCGSVLYTVPASFPEFFPSVGRRQFQ